MQRLSLVWEIANTQVKALPGAATKPLNGFESLRSNTLKIVATKKGTYSFRDNEVTLDSLSLERERERERSSPSKSPKSSMTAKSHWSSETP